MKNEFNKAICFVMVLMLLIPVISGCNDSVDTVTTEKTSNTVDMTEISPSEDTTIEEPKESETAEKQTESITSEKITEKEDTSEATVTVEPETDTLPVTTEPVTTEEVTTEKVTEPPVTTVPVTDPPVTTVPVTEPPVTTVPVTTEPETDPPETEPVTTPVPTVKTTKPEVLDQSSIAGDRVIIYGKCEADSMIRVFGGVAEEINEANSTYFYIEVSGSGTKSVSITATAPGKKESDAITTNVTFGGGDRVVWGGRNSRIFYKPTLSFLLGQVVASQENVNDIKNIILNNTLPRIQNATGKKTKIIFTLIPDPATVYYDEQRSYVANAIHGVPTMPMTQFIAAITDASEDVYALDLLTEFRNHKDERIYFSTDTHYTEYGGYYAYLKIMDVVKKYQPSAKVRTIENGDYTVEFIDVTGGDMCSMVGISMREVVPFFVADFDDTGTYYISKRNDGIKSAGFNPSSWTQNSVLQNSNNPTAYVIGDSYGCYILPFIGANFSKVWTNSGVLWNYPIDYQLLAREKPDYIIFVMCERNIDKNFANLYIFGNS